MPLSLSVAVERWPLRERFAISRGTKTEALVVVAELGDGSAKGRGECVPYARYGESVEGVVGAIEAMQKQLAASLGREDLQTAMPAGAARNALDCAFWDLAAKQARCPVHELLGVAAPQPLVTAYTISLASPHEMAAAARKATARPLLKIKLGGEGDPDRIAAVRDAVPNATLIVDANEGWRPDNLAVNLAACVKAGVRLIEQPLPDGGDAMLATFPHPLPICADESAHGLASLPALAGKYDAVNVKLDKAGGLSESLAMQAAAERMGMQTMVGCMVASSLAMAPAMLLAQRARYVDLDGPLLLAEDRANGLRYEGSTVFPPSSALWG